LLAESTQEHKILEKAQKIAKQRAKWIEQRLGFVRGRKKKYCHHGSHVFLEKLENCSNVSENANLEV
jgi:hypothetical protein